MLDNIDFNKFKAILCLNGELPSQDFFTKQIPIIAADGAANQLMRMGITPQMVIGDLDSIESQHKEQLPIHFHYDQNYCDYQKAFFYLQEHELLPAIILGINGGALDHVLNNINYFMTTKSVLYAPPLFGFTLSASEQTSLALPLDTKLSILGIPTATVSSQGLKWELTNYAMSFPGANSCFNRTVQEQISLDVHAGAALILVYTTKMT